MKVTIETVLSCETMGSIELPVANWQEIKDYFVRWDTLHYTLDGEEWHKVAINSGVDSIIDWKYPLKTTILSDNLDVLASLP